MQVERKWNEKVKREITEGKLGKKWNKKIEKRSEAKVGES